VIKISISTKINLRNTMLVVTATINGVYLDLFAKLIIIYL